MGITLIRIVFILLAKYLEVSFAVKCLEAETIIGGYLAKLYQYKYQVSVLENGEVQCGGGVIGSQQILTAAHCFLNAETGKLKQAHFAVMVPAVNEYSSSSLKKIYEIDKLYMLGSYQPDDPKPMSPNQPEGDIVVIKLKKDLNLETNDNVEKLEIPKRNHTYFGKTAVLVGQGYNKVKISSNSTMELGASDGKLRYIFAEIREQAVCDLIQSHPFHKSLICAQALQRSHNKREGTCVGDSGGPLVYMENIVIGILITGPIGCREHKIGATYTRVSTYKSFIQSALADRNSSDVRVFTLTKKGFLFKQYKFVENYSN